MTVPLKPIASSFLGLLFFVLVSLLPALTFAQDAPTIQACGGVQQFCVDEPLFDICVSIIVDPAYMEEIDFFEIDWGDGTMTTVPFSPNPPDQSHEYDFSNIFFGENICNFLYDEINVRLNTFLVGESIPINNSFAPTFINFPTARIGNAQPFVCVGEEVCFQDSSCPTTGLSFLGWSLADGTPLPDNGCFTFDTPGTYTIQLAVENDCGPDQATHTFTVLEPATADIDVTTGIANPGPGNAFTACLVADSVFVTLDGALLSANETNYFWQVISGSTAGFAWVLEEPNDNPTSSVQQIVFTQEGTYEIRLTTNNECDQSAQDIITITVEGGGVSIDPQPDGCVSLDYTPNPLLTDATYTINGETVSNFPITLGPDTYVVKVNGISSFCAAEPACDTFSVLTQEIANILTSDTTLCALDPPLTYEGTPADDGVWRIDGTIFTGVIDPSNYTPGTYTITYGNEPCLTTASVSLTIIDAGLDLPPTTELCVDDPPRQFMASPPDGVYSGTGITPEGLFDPAAVPPGDYMITYELVNNDFPACSNLDSFLVTVTELVTGFSVGSCEGNTLCFELEGTTDGVQATWDFGGTGPGVGLTPCHTFPTAGSYEVTVTITRGSCTATATQTIIIEAPPVAGFSLDFDPDLCSSLNVAIADEASGNNLRYEWYLNGELISEESNPGDLLLEAFASPTSFTLLQVVRNDCTSDSAEQTLVVQPEPVANFGMNLTQYCSGDTLIIANISTGLPTSYQWSFNGTLIGTDSLPPLVTYQTTSVDTLELCLTVTNTCGDSTLCTPLVFVPTDVTALFNLDPAVVCLNDSIDVTSFATPGANHFYDLGDGNTTAQPSFRYQYAAPGEYLIRQQIFGCGFAEFAQTVTVVPAPAVSWINPAFGCPGDPLMFTNSSPTAMQYLWDFGDGNTSQLASPTHAFTSPGTYTVCLSVFETSATDCSATRCEEVVIYTPIVADFTVTDSLCVGDEIIATNASLIPPISCFYDWGDGNTSNACNATHVYAAAGDYVVTQILTDSNGCPDTVQQSIYVRPLPEPGFSVTTMDACAPDSVQFTNLSFLATSYLWDFGDGTTSTLTNPSHVYATGGTFTVTLTALRDGICTASTSQTITIAPSPTVSIATDGAAVCAGSNNVFTSQVTGPEVTYQWRMGDGTAAFSESVTYAYAMAGMYPVSLVVTTDVGCADTAFLEVVVAPAIAVTADLTPVTCAGGSDGAVTLTYTAGTEPFSTNWSNGATSTSINDLPAGTYQVATIDSVGCVWDSTFLVPAPPPLTATLTSTIVTCAGGEDGTVRVEEITGGLPPYQFNWQDGGTDSLRTGLSTGVYTLNLTDALGCSNPYEVEVLENAPVVFLDSTLEISCFGFNDGAITIDSIMGGTGPYETFLTGPQVASGVNVTRFDSLGAGTYLLEVVDVNGCTGEAEHVLLEPSPANINVRDSVINLLLGESAMITTFFNASEPTFDWSPKDGLSCTDCPEPEVSPEINTRYIVQLTDNRGCVDFDTLLVRVNTTRDIWLPEAFTPNFDNRNDVFTVRTNFPLAIERIEHFRIFDRWGGLLFEQTDLPPNDDRYGWDGADQDGIPIVPGVYVYQVLLRYQGQSNTSLVQGDVLLIR